MSAGYKVSIHVDTLEEAQAVQELALEAFGFPVTISTEERDRPAKPTSEWRSGKILLAHFRANPSRTYTSEDVGIVMEEAGFSPNTATVLLSKLTSQGVIKRIGTGVYRLAALNEITGA